MALKTYDGSQVSVVFYGIPIAGTADKTFVTVEANEDMFTLQVGVNGDACRSKSNNRSAKITVAIGQHDSVNAALSALYALDVLSPSGDGIGPLIVKDNSGFSIYAAEKAWITKPATAEFGRESGTREWVIETNELSVFVNGGN